MLEKINLLPFKRAVSPREKRAKWVLQVLSLAVLGAYILGVSSLLGFGFWLKNKQQGLEGRIVNLREQIAGYRQTEILYRRYVTKLEDLAAVLEVRPDFLKVLKNVELMKIQGIELTKAEAVKMGVLKFSGQAKDSASLDSLNLTILGEKDFTEATFSGVLGDKEGNLKFDLEIKQKLLP